MNEVQLAVERRLLELGRRPEIALDQFLLHRVSGHSGERNYITLMLEQALMSATRDGALPPSTDGPESYLEGQTPNVLSDRVLGLHSAAPRPPATATPYVDHGEGDSEDERDGLLDSATRHNTSRSRSRIRVARIVWYRRPSPIW